jgi:hypothetical protein
MAAPLRPRPPPLPCRTSFCKPALLTKIQLRPSRISRLPSRLRFVKLRLFPHKGSFCIPSAFYRRSSAARIFIAGGDHPGGHGVSFCNPVGQVPDLSGWACGPRTAMKQRWDRRFRLSSCGVGAGACPPRFQGCPDGPCGPRTGMKKRAESRLHPISEPGLVKVEAAVGLLRPVTCLIRSVRFERTSARCLGRLRRVR